MPGLVVLMYKALLESVSSIRRWFGVLFFKFAALFCTENMKLWPILAILLRIYERLVYCYGAKSCGGVPKLTNIRYVATVAADTVNQKE